MSSSHTMALEPIPQPPTHLYGMLANLPEIDPSFPLSSFWRLHALYGPIFQLDLISRKVIVLSNYELAHEVMDDERFEKVVTAALIELRPLIKDGLFSAFPHEQWKAHRTLMPVFGPMGVRKMFPEQLDIASQLVLRWDRFGPTRAIDTGDELAFDTIGICAFNYRFNNFYAEHMHPFATQMAAALIESGKRANRTQMENKLRLWANKQLQDNIHEMHKLCDDLVAERKAHPQPGVNDLLNTMLNVADPVTGEKLDDENIRYQMVTFLIAGHETTSGTLSYLFYNLLKHPETLHKAQQEVDSVLGDDTITAKHIDKFKYIDACLKETLRLNGPIGQVSRRAKHDTVIGGRYQIPADYAIVTNLRGFHSDPAVWGEDAAEFKPERMLDMAKYPSDAFKPFGVGMRSCIGRAFAEQEMILNVALILQRFQVEMADPSYVLVNKSTLTIKPDSFFIKVRRRPGKGPMVGLADMGAPKKTTQDGAHGSVPEMHPKKKMTVLYGSNAGTCKAFAEDLQTNAPGYGFEAEVLTLDQATENVSKEQPVVIITASYEGKPPDNAAKFVSWLETSSPSFRGVRYAVFGLGNSEWVSTYQRIPKLIDGYISSNGGDMIVEPWWTDVKHDCTDEWENWTEKLWKQLVDSDGTGAQPNIPSLKAEVIKHDMPQILGGKDMSWAVVKSARSLGGLEVGLERRELEIELPPDVHYQAGDYFVVLPTNPPETVARVLAYFNLHPDDLISISDTRKTHLQTPTPIPAHTFFSTRVELSTPPTQRLLTHLLTTTPSAHDATSLNHLLSTYPTSILAPSLSTLALLSSHPSTPLPLPLYISSLPPLHPRQYSIASSPLASPSSCSLLYAVLRAPSRADPDTPFLGAASTYLARLALGARLHGFVRATNAAFHLPADPETPVILIAAGTGIAPMRGFVVERVARVAAGGRLGKALLYYGVRDFEKDFVCEGELREAERVGAVGVRMAFSRRGPPAEVDGEGTGGGQVDGESTGGYRYVHERIWAEREECAEMFRAGAKILLCGSAGKVGRSTAEVLKRIWLENNEGKTEAEAEEWLQRVKVDRFVSDVFD